MALRHRLLRKVSRFIFLIILAAAILLIMIHAEICQCPQYSLSPLLTLSSTPLSSMNISSNTEDEAISVDHLWIWCPEIELHIDDEKEIPDSPLFHAPSLNESRLRRLPYHYSRWKSSSLLPRRITPCEHHRTMHLLMIIARICREHNLTFAMSDGTVLGSWRHHDIIPWDDDVDLMMPIEDQLSFLRALEELQGTVVQYYLIEYPLNNQPYAIVFFQYKPSPAPSTWTFPFVDIFFYLTNETHLWYSSHPNADMQLEHVFPLVMRPFGYFWLPAPREPHFIFKFDAQTECNSHWHDHRKERGQE